MRDGLGRGDGCGVGQKDLEVWGSIYQFSYSGCFFLYIIPSWFLFLIYSAFQLGFGSLIRSLLLFFESRGTDGRLGFSVQIEDGF